MQVQLVSPRCICVGRSTEQVNPVGNTGCTMQLWGKRFSEQNIYQLSIAGHFDICIRKLNWATEVKKQKTPP